MSYNPRRMFSLQVLVPMLLLIFLLTGCGNSVYEPDLEKYPNLRGQPVFQALDSNSVKLSQPLIDEFSGKCDQLPISKEQLVEIISGVFRTLERDGTPITEWGRNQLGNNVEISYTFPSIESDHPDDVYIMSINDCRTY